MWRPLLGLGIWTIVGCSTRLQAPPPPPPEPIEPTVIVENLPVVEPAPPPEPVAVSAPPADPATPAPAPRDGGSDPFRSDTVDDNKTGKQIMEQILTLPEADAPTPAPPP